MKKTICLLAIVMTTIGFFSCNDEKNNDSNYDEQNLELRASILGFEDVESYKTCVAEQCLAGNHENCDIFSDGTHRACAFHEHSGTRRDGSHHDGTSHGTHNEHGHSHGSHEGGHH